MRLFAGVFPSTEALEKIVAVQQEMISKTTCKASWTKPEKMHLTLRFYGSCEDVEKPLTQIEGSLSDIGRFSFHLQKAGGFPSARRARVAFLDPVESEKLFLIANRLKAEGERDPHPHLTLARFREPSALPDVSFDPITFDVDRIALVSSVLGKGGATYQIVREWELP